MSEVEAQYWAQMQAEAKAHEAEQAAAQAAEYEAAMEAEQAKQEMKPFRAWVAWSPGKSSRLFATVYGSWLDAALFVPDENVRSKIAAAVSEGLDVVASVLAGNGWRIVEVEVREVQK